MYRDNEKTMCAGKSALGGAVPSTSQCEPVDSSKLRDVIGSALGYLTVAKANLDQAEQKLFGQTECGVTERATEKNPIEVLAYQVRDLARGLASQASGIDDRL